MSQGSTGHRPCARGKSRTAHEFTPLLALLVLIVAICTAAFASVATSNTIAGTNVHAYDDVSSINENDQQISSNNNNNNNNDNNKKGHTAHSQTPVIRFSITPRNLTLEDTTNARSYQSLIEKYSKLYQNYSRLNFGPRSRAQLKDCLQKSLVAERNADAAKWLGLHFLFGFPADVPDGEEAQCTLDEAAKGGAATDPATATDAEERARVTQRLENLQKKDPLDYFDVNVTRAVVYLHEAEMLGDADAPVYLLFVAQMGLLIDNFRVDFAAHTHDLRGVMQDLLNAGIRRESVIAHMVAFNEIRRCEALAQLSDVTEKFIAHVRQYLPRGGVPPGVEVLDFMLSRGRLTDGSCLSCTDSLDYGIVSADVSVEALSQIVTAEDMYVDDFETEDAAVDATSDEEQTVLQEMLQSRADEGDALSMFTLGSLYVNGNREYGVPQDYARAYAYFEQAALLEEPAALHNAGILQLRGIGTRQNTTEAIKKLERASELGETDALVYLGELYLHGEHVPKNFTRAKEYLTMGAMQNNTNAMIVLGELYEQGFKDLIERDITVATNLYLQAAPTSVLARYKLVSLHTQGHSTNLSCSVLQSYIADTISVDHQELTRAQELFRARQYERAFAYAAFSAFLGVQDSLKNALYLMRKSRQVRCVASLDARVCELVVRYLLALEDAESRPEQLFEIGQALYDGTPAIDAHRALALEVWQLASSAHAHALYNVAYMYEHGEGLPAPNVTHAIHLTDTLIAKSLDGDFAIENLYVGLLNKAKLYIKKCFA